MKISERTNKQKTQLPELGRIRSGGEREHQVAAETATCACSGGRGGNGGNHSCAQCPIRPRESGRHHAAHGGGARCGGEELARHGAAVYRSARSPPAQVSPHQTGDRCATSAHGARLRDPTSARFPCRTRASWEQNAQARMLRYLHRCSADTVVADFCSASANDGGIRVNRERRRRRFACSNPSRIRSTRGPAAIG
jgi:hypothetical protein